MSKSYFIISFLFIVALLFSCVENNVKEEPGDQTQVNGTRVNPVPESFSADGRWLLLKRAIYTEDDKEIVGVIPPAATSPVVQLHYLEVDRTTGVRHLILVSPIEAEASPQSNYNVFLGDDRTFVWGEGRDSVETDLYAGNNGLSPIYSIEDNEFSLRFEGTNGQYDPLLVFTRLDDKLWEEANERAMVKGSDLYEEKLNEYNVFYSDVMGYQRPFPLEQFLIW